MVEEIRELGLKGDGVVQIGKYPVVNDIYSLG